ncbi:MAG: endonuclease III [Planctomycetota bacterium]
MPAKRTDSRTLKKRRERVTAILPILYAEHPDAKCSLDFTSPLELIVATILSAQCTDERVNLTTPALFKKFPTAQAYADASLKDIEPMVQSCGFFRQKAKSIKAMAESVVELHGDEVPRTMEALIKLRGVGRKTANVVLGNAFGINVGVTVDTHVTRLSNRLGLTRHESDAVKIEKDLMQVVPRDEWTMWSHLLIHHGRRTCVARKPRCEACALFEHCPSGPRIIRKREKDAK